MDLKPGKRGNGGEEVQFGLQLFEVCHKDRDSSGDSSGNYSLYYEVIIIMTWDVRISKGNKESYISIKDYNQIVSISVSISPD